MWQCKFLLFTFWEIAITFAHQVGLLVYFFIKKGRILVYFLQWLKRKSEEVAVGTLQSRHTLITIYIQLGFFIQRTKEVIVFSPLWTKVPSLSLWTSFYSGPTASPSLLQQDLLGPCHTGLQTNHLVPQADGEILNPHDVDHCIVLHSPVFSQYPPRVS